LEEQNLEDRVRIQRLLALAQPTGEDVTILLPAGSAAAGVGGFGLPRGGGGGAAAAPAGARRRSRQDQGAAAGAAAAATAATAATAAAAAAAAGEEDVVEEEGNNLPPDGTEAAYKRKQGEWIARALKSEKDPRVAVALEELQSLNYAIERSKASYEQDVLELQRRRALREAEAAEVLSPLLKEGEETVRKMEEQERGVSEDIQRCLRMIVEGLGDKAAILNEHARLARLQKVVAARVRTFHARVAKRGQVVLEEERARVEKEVEGEGVRLREELVGIEQEIREVNERFARERPRMEQKLRVLNAAMERRKEGLSREKRRYRLDKEGWENEVRMSAAAVMKARRLEEKLRVERRAAAVAAREEEEIRAAEEGGRGEREEEEVEEEEEEEDNLEELDDLMFQLELLMSKEEEGVQ